MTEYIGCKILKININSAIKITQSVFVHSVQDKFYLPKGIPPKTPSKTGTTLIKQTEEEPFHSEKHTIYQAGIGKLQHLVQNARPDIGNAVCTLSQQLVKAT